VKTRELEGFFKPKFYQQMLKNKVILARRGFAATLSPIAISNMGLWCCATAILSYALGTNRLAFWKMSSFVNLRLAKVKVYVIKF